MKWFTKFFKKLLKAIKKILAVVLVIIAVLLILWSALATGGATLALLGFTLTTTGAMIAGCVALVGAFLIDGNTSGKVIGKLGDAVGSAAGAVAGAAGSAVGGALTGVVGALLHNPVILGVGLFVLGYYLLSGDDSDKVESDKSSAPVRRERVAAERSGGEVDVRREGKPTSRSAAPTPYGMSLEA